MITITVLTEKGGVGKTTTAIHLGACMAHNKKKVLLIDFDSQTNLSQGYKIRTDTNYNIQNFLEGSGQFRIKEKSKNLYVLPGSKTLESLNLDRNSLRRSLDAFSKHFNFDYCIIDSPPRPLIPEKLALGEIALTASNYIISPIEPEEYSISGINNLIPQIERVKTHNPSLALIGFFFNKVEINSRRFSTYNDLLRNSPAGPFLLKSYVRKDVAIEDAKVDGKTIFQTAPTSRAAEDFKSLANEVLKRMKT